MNHFLKLARTLLIGLSLLSFIPSIVMAQNNTTTDTSTTNQSIKNLKKQFKTLQQENQTLQNNLTELQAQDQQLQSAQQNVLTANQNLLNTNNQLTQQITQLQQQLLASNQIASTLNNTLTAIKQAKPPQLTFSQFIQRFNSDNRNQTESLQPFTHIDLLIRGGIPFLALILMLFIALPIADIIQSYQKNKPVVSPQPDTKIQPAPIDVNVQRYTSFAGEDVIASKLDLAHAYINMGHTANAQVLIKEILEEGSEQQRVDARKLLAQIES